jgi:hypothetical protein
MYRYYFNCQSGRWEVHLKRKFFFWEVIKDTDFAFYDAAKLFVEQTGIDFEYDYVTTKGRPTISQSLLGEY